MAFAREMLKTFQTMLRSRQGFLVEPGADALKGVDIVNSLPEQFGLENFGQADLGAAFNYLRGAKSLKIPSEWYHVLPTGFRSE